jgi:hypothetical protein
MSSVSSSMHSLPTLQQLAEVESIPLRESYLSNLATSVLRDSALDTPEEPSYPPWKKVQDEPEEVQIIHSTVLEFLNT